MDVGVAVGFENALGIGAVRLVSRDVGSDLVRGQEHDLVSEAFDLTSPVVADPQASMTTVSAGVWAKKTSSSDRSRRRWRLTRPGSSETAISNLVFARSIAMTVLFSMGSSLFCQPGRLWHLMPTESIGGVHSINEADRARRKRWSAAPYPRCSADPTDRRRE